MISKCKQVKIVTTMLDIMSKMDVTTWINILLSNFQQL